MVDNDYNYSGESFYGLKYVLQLTNDIGETMPVKFIKDTYNIDFKLTADEGTDDL